MKTRYLLAAVGVFAGGWLVAGRGDPLAGDGTTFSAQAAQAGAVSDGAADKSLDVRYAQAFLKMAEADLRKAQDANERVAGTIPDSVLQPLQSTVIVAKERLDQLEHPNDKNNNPYLDSAEAMLKIARDNWKQALTINQRAAGAIRQSEVDRLQAVAELAQVRVEQARALDLQSPLACAIFDLEQLRLEVHQLFLNVSRLRDRN
jgi:hypothetical protein